MSATKSMWVRRIKLLRFIFTPFRAILNFFEPWMFMLAFMLAVIFAPLGMCIYESQQPSQERLNEMSACGKANLQRWLDWKKAPLVIKDLKRIEGECEAKQQLIDQQSTIKNLK